MKKLLGLLLGVGIAFGVIGSSHAQYAIVGPMGGASFSSICPTASNGQLLYDSAGTCAGVTGWTTNGTTTLTGGAGTTIAIGGAIIGTDAIAVTGTSTFTGAGVFTHATAAALSVKSGSNSARLSLDNSSGVGQIGFTSGSAATSGTTGLVANSTAVLQFTNGTAYGGTTDTGLSRVSAGVVGVGTGAAGSVAGTLQAAQITVGATGTGFYQRTATAVTAFSSSTDYLELTPGKLQLRSALVQAWSSGNIGAADDTGLSRISAGVLGVGTGAAGSIAGGLQAATASIGGGALGGNAFVVTGASAFAGNMVSSGTIQVKNGTAITAGGVAAYLATSTGTFGIYFGSGAPTVSAAKGSLYLRSDGTTTNDRAYINTDGGTTWTPLTTGSWLLNRDLDPAANDNTPAFMDRIAA